MLLYVCISYKVLSIDKINKIRVIIKSIKRDKNKKTNKKTNNKNEERKKVVSIDNGGSASHLSLAVSAGSRDAGRGVILQGEPLVQHYVSNAGFSSELANNVADFGDP